MSARAGLTLYCILVAVWIYVGVDSYYENEWVMVGLSAFWIGFLWHLIWRDFDRAKEGME